MILLIGNRKRKKNNLKAYVKKIINCYLLHLQLTCYCTHSDHAIYSQQVTGALDRSVPSQAKAHLPPSTSKAAAFQSLPEGVLGRHKVHWPLLACACTLILYMCVNVSYSYSFVLTNRYHPPAHHQQEPV